MMDKVYKAGLIGCGDYLRWEIDVINNSKHLDVKYTFDLDKGKAEKRAGQLNAQVATSADDIFNDQEIKVVMIFTPPWVRKDLFQKAVENGKHILTTKPLAPNVKDAQYLCDLVEDKVNCSVFYRRTGDPFFEKLKEIFDSGEIGKLTVYKQDWFHHYPQWNQWATDPEKNGGPFMDAMVHNQNIARYLMGREAESVQFFSGNYAQNLKCNDTEAMKLNFKDDGVAYLFITWAGDLEVFSLDGNEREHLDYLHMITDQGWYVVEKEENNVQYVVAKKESEVKQWKVEPLPVTPYDQFVINIEKNQPQPFDIRDALKDIIILETGVKNRNELCKL